MPVEIKFESGQEYQLDAIDAVCSLFQGWNQADSGNGIDSRTEEAEALFAESLFANHWGISDEDILSNAKRVQSRTRENSLGEHVEVIPIGSRLNQEHTDPLRDFSVEMETGTGKTYVYLRTAIELYLRFNLSKFVIVVPTVAIREGVLASLQMMKNHFRDVYAGVQYDSYVYESKNVNRLRQFASSKHLQILVMNIQAFNKDSAIIMRAADNLNGMKPIDFITRVNPVVILDEPQKLDNTPVQKAAIESLNPLFKLRYSATHKDPHCLVYRLGPVDAYEKRLVKRIEVLSMVADEDLNVPFVEVRKITLSNNSPSATIAVNMPDGRKEKPVTARVNLADLTQRNVYQGWIVEDIVPSTDERRGYVHFTNGKTVFINTNSEIDDDYWQKSQIAASIEKHFETEHRLIQAASNGEISPMKPLTLFFIDRVSNYDPEDGKFKIWFDELYEEIAKVNRKYRSLTLPSAKEARAGYFASTKGKAKDTNGDSQDDAAAYDLIMKDKERLLSPDEPVRFIFSHSALSEGWDNPNVFTICNLQEVRSEVKRRQQIGRGLRLPVMADGERCRIERLNMLTVVATESFEKFAAELQREIHLDTGESFGEGAIVNERKRLTVELKENYQNMAGFKELWAKIAPRTRYELDYRSEDLIDEASKRLKDFGSTEPIAAPKIVLRKTVLEMVANKDFKAGSTSGEKVLGHTRKIKIPDILSDLQGALPVSRSSIVRVIEKSGRLSDLAINPAQFVSQVRRSIQHALANTIVDHAGIKYSKLSGEDSTYSAKWFEQNKVEAYGDLVVPVEKSIYNLVVCDSNVEREFAQKLDKMDEIELFLKLPNWFKIPTPIGNYNPDWAIVRKLESGEKRVYLVRETKGTTDVDALRFEGEGWKIAFGRRHFEAIEVDYEVAVTADKLYERHSTKLVEQR